CLANSAGDSICLGLMVQTEWLRADQLMARHLPTRAALNAALALAKSALASNRQSPENGWLVAATYSRMARDPLARIRQEAIALGLTAAGEALSVNAKHARALAAEGQLLLVRAKGYARVEVRRSAAESAVLAITQALEFDPLLRRELAPLLAEAQREALQ